MAEEQFRWGLLSRTALEVLRDAGTKVAGTLAKGAKVTVKYKMTATSVEVKADKASSSTKKKAA